MTSSREHYEAVLADLLEQRERLDTMISFVRETLGHEPSESEGTKAERNGRSKSVQVAPTEIPRNAFSGLPLQEAIKSYLRMVNQRQSPKDIMEGLVRGGLHTTSKKLYPNVYSSLLRLEKAGDLAKFDNQWGLVEWYPAMKKGTAQTRSVEKAPNKISTGEQTVPEAVDVLVNEADT
jgi:hypothetical protein